MRQVAQVGLQLLQHAQIQPKARAQRRQGLGGGRAGFAGHHIGRITGCELQQQKVQNRYAQHRGYCIFGIEPERSQ